MKTVELPANVQWLLQLSQSSKKSTVFVSNTIDESCKGKVELTKQEIECLYAINGEGEATQKEVADIVCYSPARTGQLLKRLEKDGLIESYEAEGHKQRKYYSLTTIGLTKINKVSSQLDSHIHSRRDIDELLRELLVACKDDPKTSQIVATISLMISAYRNNDRPSMMSMYRELGKSIGEIPYV